MTHNLEDYETLRETAREADTRTAFDLNYRSKLWSPSDARNVLTKLFPAIDVLVLAERDAPLVQAPHVDVVHVVDEARLVGADAAVVVSVAVAVVRVGRGSHERDGDCGKQTSGAAEGPQRRAG